MSVKRIFGIKRRESNMSQDSESAKSLEMSEDHQEQQGRMESDQGLVGEESKEESGKGKENESSEEENEPVESLLPSSYNRSSLFSRDRNTFQTFSTNPTSAGSGTSSFFNPQSKHGGIKIDNIGKPLRVVSTDKYNELSRVGTSNSQHSTSSGHGGSFSRRRRSDNLHPFESGSVTTGGSGNNEGVGGGAEGGNMGQVGDHGSRSGSRSGSAAHNIINNEMISKELGFLNEHLLGLIDQLNQSVINVSKATILFIELLDDCLPYPIPSQYAITSTGQNEHVGNIVKIALQFYDNYLRYEVYLNSKNLLVKSLKEFLSRLQFKFNFNNFETVPYMQNFAITDEISFPNKNKIERIMETISQSSSSIISDQQGSFIAPIMRGLTHKSSILAIMFGFPEPQSEHYEIINALFQTFPDVHFFVKQDFIKPCGMTTKPSKFTPPFKIPHNKRKPEISLSISSETSIKTSGTLGGFIEPKFTPNTDKSLLKYKGSKFAITCAHVLLSESQDYPEVNVPSNVLVSAYRSALRDERDKYPEGCVEYNSYNEELKKAEGFSTKIGQVVWGERILLNKKISDLAIVKCANGIKCENSLGDDLDSYNTSLKFKNLQLKRKITTKEFNKHTKVFKIGASTKYTSGEINGIKLVYWLDGSLQTSEFVVSSPEPIFANSGDSGALILNNLYGETGLGVIGMLHSFDGELKQFGLFTPVDDLLDRLQTVTGVDWDFIYS